MSEATAPPPKPRSDLGIRTISGVLMMSVAIAAIWYGGYAFIALVILVGLGIYWEFSKLVIGFTDNPTAIALWLLGGLIYVGFACFTLLVFSSPFLGAAPAVVLIASVIGTDVGAYFVGRTVGGPKIAPKISPSKTWSGLVGGMIGAAIAVALFLVPSIDASDPDATIGGEIVKSIAIGSIIAIVAQAGDFFESWMKRRAGVKDSGRLIPGHGGLFDRTDGLIAVAFVAGLYSISALGMFG
jgi:phosphatidate cytidylyltransferase